MPSHHSRERCSSGAFEEAPPGDSIVPLVAGAGPWILRLTMGRGGGGTGESPFMMFVLISCRS